MDLVVVLLACSLILSSGIARADGADAENKDADKVKAGDLLKAGENDKANSVEDKEKKNPARLEQLAKEGKKEEKKAESLASKEAEKTKADEEAEKIGTEQKKKHPANETENSEPVPSGTEREKSLEKENYKSNVTEKDKTKVESVIEQSENKTAEQQHEQQQEQQQQQQQQQLAIPTEPQTNEPVESSIPVELGSTDKPHQAAAEEAAEAHNATQTPALIDEETSAESKSVWNCILNELPQELRIKIVATDEAEVKLLDSHAASQTVSADILRDYKTAKEEERRLLKDLLSELGIDGDNILAAYKALRKGDAWNYEKLDPQVKSFFEHQSNARTQFEALKADELNYLDSYLSSSPKTRDAEGEAGALTDEVASENEVEVIERIARAAGVDKFVRRATTVRGNVGESRTAKAGEILGGDSGVAASEEAATKTADLRSVNYRSIFVKFAIICSVIGVLSAAFVSVIACRKRVDKWRADRKAMHSETDMEHLHTNDEEYSRIEGNETDAREESANFSMISVANVGGVDRPWRESVKSFPIRS